MFFGRGITADLGEQRFDAGENDETLFALGGEKFCVCVAGWGCVS